MIILGYPCIGKSSVARSEIKVIDLESSYFKKPDGDNTGWEENYCNLAHELSEQGYAVFVSTHKEVQEYIAKKGWNDISIVYPSLDLKDMWIKRATERLEQTRLLDPIKVRKDHMALDRIESHFDDDIHALASSPIICTRMVIDDPKYDLNDIIFKQIPELLGLKL